MICKYYKDIFKEIRKNIEQLYSLPDCSAGGLLHVILDDGNVRDEDINWAVNYVEQHKNYEDYLISKVILDDFIKLNEQERRLIVELEKYNFICYENRNCENCWIEKGFDF